MIDPRVRKQAKILVDHSIKLKAGDKAMVVADVAARPLVQEIYRLLVARGASEIRLNLGWEELSEIYLKNATKKQLKTFPKISMDETKQIDCYIGIKSPTNTRYLSSIDPNLISDRSKVTKPILDWRVEKTRWVITNFPTEAQAQDADMSLSEYEDFVFSGINDVDWEKKYRQQEELRKLFNNGRKVRIAGTDTDITMSIAGRKTESDAGEHNMPGGEVFTSVVENSTEGYITFTYPALYYGREFHEVRLEFKSGKAVKAQASKNEEALNKILDMDAGARRLGELGIGNNYKITRFTKDILFDEKIGGSVHMALGKGYKETLSKNKSALHWDMIKDLRPPAGRAGEGGEIWLDGKLMQKDGDWVVSGI